jgi:hypothetical protein
MRSHGNTLAGEVIFHSQIVFYSLYLTYFGLRILELSNVKVTFYQSFNVITFSVIKHQYPEQRKIIKCWCELGYSSIKTYEMKEQSSVGKIVSKTQVFEWHRRFHEGRQSLEDDSREGFRRLLKHSKTSFSATGV